MGALPIALQVYSIREEAENNFVETMHKVKALGYDGVELAGLYGHNPKYIRDVLKEIGLNPISAHIPYDEFVKDLNGTVKAYAVIGCRYVVIPYLLEDYRYGTEKFNEVMSNIPIISKACQKEGLTLLYHNHDFEFEKTSDDEYILDYMYRVISSEELKVELDTCWVKFSGVDPAEYLRKYSGRCPIVHLKDYTGATPIEFEPIGYGVQDIPSIVEEAGKVGCEWLIVEQDRHTKHSAMEDVELSRNYLKGLGL